MAEGKGRNEDGKDGWYGLKEGRKKGTGKKVKVGRKGKEKNADEWES